MPMMALRNSFAVERNKVDKQDSTFSPGHAHDFLIYKFDLEFLNEFKILRRLKISNLSYCL
jgi:hypothetical protein